MIEQTPKSVKLDPTISNLIHCAKIDTLRLDWIKSNPQGSILSFYTMDELSSPYFSSDWRKIVCLTSPTCMLIDMDNLMIFWQQTFLMMHSNGYQSCICLIGLTIQGLRKSTYHSRCQCLYLLLSIACQIRILSAMKLVQKQNNIRGTLYITQP